jgi:DNA-binding transcriptional LysR family regulator
MMDLVLIQSLLAVEEAGSITAAAEQIHVSQSALSRRLQQLESDLGAELFVRGRHGVELTAVGCQAVEHGRRLVARYERLRRDIAEHLGLEHGTVRLGGGATVTSYLLPPAIAGFRARYGGLRFFVKEAGSLEIAADVAAGEIELGFVTLPVPHREVEVTELLTDEVVLVAAPDHELAGRSVAAEELDGQQLIAFEPGSAIRQVIDARLRDAGVEMEVAMELRSIPSILQMVLATGSLAFVSRLSLHADLRVQPLPVRGLSISRRIGIATRRGFPLSAPAAAFVEVLRDS